MIVVLVVAAGASWESEALRVLGEDAGMVVLKRCVDVDDLLATAAAGQADVAVLGWDAPGLDLAAIDHLGRHDVHAVAVLPPGPQQDAARLGATRIGVRTLVGAHDLASLPAAVSAASRGGPAPAGQPTADAHDEHPPTGSTEADAPSDDAAAPPAPAPARGRVVVVWGPPGAPGRSTLAAALAADLARRGRRTVLVDADTHAASLAQQLGVLDEVSGLLAAARLVASGHLAAGLDSVQRALDARLRLVTGLPRPDRWREVRPGTIEALLGELVAQAWVVVDTAAPLEDEPSADLAGRGTRNQATLEALGCAEEVVVVGAADPVGLARLARGVVGLRETVGVAPVRVVVNRMRPGLGWSQDEVAAMVGEFTRVSSLHFLPHDLATLDRSLVTGRTLVEGGDSALLRAVAAVVDVLDPPRAATAGEGGATGRSRVSRRRGARARRR